MSKKSPVDSDNYYLYPGWFEGGNQSQPSTSSYSYPTLEYIWSNAVRLTRTTHSNLQDEIEYLEKNISGGGGSCNCSELQYGIDKNSTKIYYNSVNITSNANKITNLSDIKLSRDGSQPMEGELICNNGLKTNTIKARTQSILDCQSQLRVNTNLGGDGDNGLCLGSDFNIGAPAINLYPYASSANGKIFIKTPRSDGIVIPRIEIPGKEDIVDIKIRESNIIPYDDNYQDLGSGSNRWKSIYAISGNFSGTIVPDAILTNSANISDLDARVDYLEENLSTCNCSALQFGIDSNTTKIENLSVIKLSRDGSQSMTGVLKCESGVETNIIDSYSGDKVECSDDFKVDGNILGDSVDGLSLKAEEGDDVAEIELSPGSTGKILMSTPTSQGVVLPRLEIPDGTGNVDITISNAHIIPSINNWQDLGSPNKRWENIYAEFVHSSNISSLEERVEYLESIIGEMGGIGSYSAVVYKDDEKIYARDKEGHTIAVGDADVDDARVIENAIAAGVKSKIDAIIPKFSTFDDMDDPIGSGWTALRGDETLSQDTSDKKEGTASLKIVGGTSDDPGAKLTGTFDWSEYSVVEFYVKAGTGKNVLLKLSDGSGNYYKWETYLRSDDWEHLEFDLTCPTWHSGSFSLANFTNIEIYIRTSSDNYTFRVDFLVLNNWYALSEPFIHETSEVVKNGNGTTYMLGEDYELDVTQGRIKPIPLTTSIVSGTTLNITYDYGRIRIVLLGGHYKLEDDLNLDKSFLTVEGLPAEAGVSIIDFQEASYSIIINKSYITLKNLSIINSDTNLIEIPTTRFVKYNINLERLFFENGYRGILVQSDKTSFEIQNLKIDSCTFKKIVQNALGIKDEIINGIRVTNCNFIDCVWYDWGAGVVFENVDGKNIVFDNCHFENIGDTALHIEAHLHHVSITNCIFYRNGKQGWADGLVISGAGDVTVSNCFFKENDKYGLMLWNNGPINIIGCIFSNNRQGGIAYVKNARIVSNVFYSTGFAGGIASESSIIGNKFIECGLAIGDRNMVLGNYIYESSGHGIDLGAGIGSSKYNVVSYNIVKNCKYSGILLRPESEKNVVTANICVDNNKADTSWLGGITVWSTKRNVILGNLCYKEDSVNYHQNYGISLWYDTGSTVRNNLVNAIQRKGEGSIKNIYEFHSDLFTNVLAEDVDYVHAAITPDGAEHIDTTNPDVPRNVIIRITNTDGSNPQTPDGGDIVIEGIDTRGISISETLTVPNSEIPAGGHTDVYGDKAFATVTKVTYYSESNSNIVVSVGISDKLGLSNPIYSSGDVYKVKKNNADIDVPAVDVANGTVDCATITNGDDFTIYYRSNLNIIE